MNVLKKIVIPRTNVTIGYILMELEEMAREEFCRLKKVKENKKRDKDEREKNDQSTDTVDHASSFNNQSNIRDIAQLENTVLVVNVETNHSMKPERETDLEIHKFQIASSSKTSSIEIDLQEKVTHLKEYFEELVLQAKEFIQKGDDSMETSKFLNKYENDTKKLDSLLNEDDYAVLDKLVNRKMEHLKCHIREIIDVTNKEDEKQINLSSCVDNINNYQTKKKEDNQSNILPEDEKVDGKYEENDIKLQEFQDIITGVEKITAAYIKQGLLPTSMEAFVKSCNEMISKINSHDKHGNINHKNKDSKQLIYGLEKNKSNISKNTEKHNEGASSCSSKLKRHTTESGENNLRMETTKNNSIDDLVNSFNKMECCIDKDHKNVQKFHHVQINLEEIINLIEKIKLEQKDSLESFFQASEDVADTKKMTDQSSSPLHIFNEDSTFPRNEDSSPQCEKLSIVERVIEENVPNVAIPCNFCKDLVNIKESVIESTCSICAHPTEEEISTIISTQTLEKSKKNRCGLCKKIIDEKVVEGDVIKTKENEGTQTEVKNNSGNFEKIKEKKVKVTRRLNTDGTILKQKETIIINETKQNPIDRTSDGDDDDDDDISDNNSIKNK